MQQINKNRESGRVFTEHLFVRLYPSSWDFDECDIRFLQEDWIKKNTYTLILSFSLFLLHRLQHLPTSTLPPLSEKKGKSCHIHLHYNANAISLASTSLICLSYPYFYFSILFQPHAMGSWRRKCALKISGLCEGEWEKRLAVYVCGPSCLYQAVRHNL